jgi:hypothetical protein
MPGVAGYRGYPISGICDGSETEPLQSLDQPASGDPAFLQTGIVDDAVQAPEHQASHDLNAE